MGIKRMMKNVGKHQKYCHGLIVQRQQVSKNRHAHTQNNSTQSKIVLKTINISDGTFPVITLSADGASVTMEIQSDDRLVEPWPCTVHVIPLCILSQPSLKFCSSPSSVFCLVHFGLSALSRASED